MSTVSAHIPSSSVMTIVAVSLPARRAGITPPGCVPASVMRAKAVKNSVPSTMRSSNPSMTTVMMAPLLTPVSNIASFVMKQKSPLNGGVGSGLVFGQSAAPLEKEKKRRKHESSAKF